MTNKVTDFETGPEGAALTGSAQGGNSGASQITTNGGSAVFSKTIVRSGALGARFNSVTNALCIGRFTTPASNNVLSGSLVFTLGSTPSIITGIWSLRGSGVAGRVNWNPDNSLSIVDAGLSNTLTVATGLVPGTVYELSIRARSATSTTGTITAVLYSSAGAELGRASSSAYNLATAALSAVDIGILNTNAPANWLAVDYLQLDDGNTAELRAPTSTPSYSGAAAFTGAGTLDVSGASSTSGQSDLTGAGTLAASGQPAATGTAALGGAGTLTAAGGAASSAAAALAGTGDLSAGGRPALAATATLAADGTLTATGVPTISGTVSLTGDGVLVLGDSTTTTGAADLTGSGALAATGRAALAAAVDLSGTGSLAAAGRAVIAGRVDLAGAGQLIAAGGNTEAAQLVLSGMGALVASGRPAHAGEAHLAGTGALTTGGTARLQGRMGLSADGGLLTDGVASFAGALDLAGTGTITARPAVTPHDITVTATLGPRRVTATMGPRRMATTTSRRRWKGTL